MTAIKLVVTGSRVLPSARRTGRERPWNGQFHGPDKTIDWGVYSAQPFGGCRNTFNRNSHFGRFVDRIHQVRDRVVY